MAYVFWNNGTPRSARVTGGGNRQRLTLPDGSVRMGRMAPDPAVDLYAFVQAGPCPTVLQTEGETSYGNDGWTVHAVRSVSWRDVANIRARRIADAKTAAKDRLSGNDWYVVRAAEESGKPVPQDVSAYRSAVRQAVDDFEVAIGLETDPAAAAILQPQWPEEPAALTG